MLGRIEITQQPEKVFYKDEGGQRLYYLFVFYVVRAARTEELRKALNKVCDGRRKIPVDCELVYDGSGDKVEDQTMLQLLGNSKPDRTEIKDGTPEFDPDTMVGSIRYRINKVSMRKDNQGFRLKFALRGLDEVIESATTEPTQVLSKRKRLRRAHRAPEQVMRDVIEEAARKRNSEVELRLARRAPGSSPLIHEIAEDVELTAVPPFPPLKVTPEEFGDGSAKRHKKNPSGLDSPEPEPGAMVDAGELGYRSLGEPKSRVEALEARVAELESKMIKFENLESALLNQINQMPSYVPGQDGAGEGERGAPLTMGISSFLQGLSSALTSNTAAAGPSQAPVRKGSLPPPPPPAGAAARKGKKGV